MDMMMLMMMRILEFDDDEDDNTDDCNVEVDDDYDFLTISLYNFHWGNRGNEPHGRSIDKFMIQYCWWW